MDMCCIQAYLKDVFKSKASQVTVVKQDDDFHVVKDNESVWAGVNYSDSAKLLKLMVLKSKLKPKECLF